MRPCENSQDEVNDEDNHVTRMCRKLFIKIYCDHEEELSSRISKNSETYVSN